jgi:tyrosine-protein phosphatase YwqE
MTIDRSNPYLRVAADVGTTTLSVHTQHVHGSYTAKTAPIREVLLKANQDPNVKQVAILEPNGNVVYGAPDVDACLSQNPGAANRTLRLWKMNLIPHFRHHKQVRHNRKILHGKQDAGYMRDFLSDHLRCILDDVRSFYKREFLSDDPEECAEYFASRFRFQS